MCRNRLTNALLNIPDFKLGLFTRLGATEVSIVAQLCRTPLSKLESERYLDPLRDLAWTRECINGLISSGYTVGLVGADIFKLMDRIEDPLNTWEPNAVITIGIVTWDNGTLNAEKEQRYFDFINSLAAETDSKPELSHPLMSIVNRSAYPMRLVLEHRVRSQVENLQTVINNTPVFHIPSVDMKIWSLVADIDETSVYTGIINVRRGPNKVEKLVASKMSPVTTLLRDIPQPVAYRPHCIIGDRECPTPRSDYEFMIIGRRTRFEFIMDGSNCPF